MIELSFIKPFQAHGLNQKRIVNLPNSTLTVLKGVALKKIPHNLCFEYY